MGDVHCSHQTSFGCNGDYVSCGRRNAACGYATLGTHPDVCLSSCRSSAQKRGKGLYRVARSASHPTCGRSMYCEFYIAQSGGTGGLCVGVLPSEGRLDRIIGDADRSIGLHASGSIVASKKWNKIGNHAGYCTGDTVSVLVVPAGATPVSDCENDSDCSAQNSDDMSVSDDNKVGDDGDVAMRIDFAVNGRVVYSTRLDMKVCDPALHVGASLYQTDSIVELRCCPSSWKFGAMFSEPLNALCNSGADEDNQVPAENGESKVGILIDTVTSSTSELTP